MRFLVWVSGCSGRPPSRAACALLCIVCLKLRLFFGAGSASRARLPSRSPTFLRTSYALSGTDVAYGTTRPRLCSCSPPRTLAATSVL
eukprot:2013863-Rhodomonas_salina.2